METNKYKQAINDLKDMALVGGTLAEADEVINVLEELVNNLHLLDEEYKTRNKVTDTIFYEIALDTNER